MAKVVFAPNTYLPSERNIFIAGAIDMGEAENWQQSVIAMLAGRNDITLLNPRRAEFKPEMEDEQIKWELHALEVSEFILMWFPKEAYAPISFLEFGLYLRSGKLLVGVEDGFYRQRNIELTARHYEVGVFHSIGELVEKLNHALDA